MVLKKMIYETLGDKTLYYREALDRDAWSLYDAVFIASGLVPIPILTPEEMLKDHPLTAALFNLAIESCVVGILKGGKVSGIYLVTPKDFFLWLAQKGWELPDELVAALGDKKLLYPSSKKKNKDSTPYYKQKIQSLGISIAEELDRFNHEEIFQHPKMQALLQDLQDPYGGKRKPFAAVTVKKWLSEVDNRPMNLRRGRPKKSK